MNAKGVRPPAATRTPKRPWLGILLLVLGSLFLFGISHYILARSSPWSGLLDKHDNEKSGKLLPASYASASAALERMKDWTESITQLQLAALAALAIAFSKSVLSERDWMRQRLSTLRLQLLWACGGLAALLLLGSMLLGTWIMNGIPACQMQLTPTPAQETGEPATGPNTSVSLESDANSIYHFVVHGQDNEYPQNVRELRRKGTYSEVVLADWDRKDSWDFWRPYLGTLNGLHHWMAMGGAIFFALFIMGCAGHLKTEEATRRES